MFCPLPYTFSGVLKCPVCVVGASKYFGRGSGVLSVLLRGFIPGSRLLDLPVFGVFRGFGWVMLDGIFDPVLLVLSGAVSFDTVLLVLSGVVSFDLVLLLPSGVVSFHPVLFLLLDVVVLERLVLVLLSSIFWIFSPFCVW